VCVCGRVRSRTGSSLTHCTCRAVGWIRAENALGDWLATFATTTLQKSPDDGANLTSVFWACLTLGRLLGAVTSRLATPSQIIASDFTMAGLGCVLLVVWGATSLTGAYIAAGLIGTGLSTLYPMGIMLAQQKLNVTGGWISVFISGGTIGSVVLPLFVGLLMSVSAHALPWAVVVLISLQLGSYLFVYQYGNHDAAVVAAADGTGGVDDVDAGEFESDVDGLSDDDADDAIQL
jgi:fucose permease